MSFCPVCGKKSNGFCEECKPIEDIKAKEIIIKICANCGKFFKNNKWISLEINEAIVKIAKDKIKDNVEIDLSNIDFDKIEQKKPGLKYNIEIQAIKDNNLFLIPAQIYYTYCEKCSKVHGKYYEGTLQIRNSNDEILDYIEKYIHNNNLKIANKRKNETGYDLDLSDQKKLQNLALNLKKNFGGKLKISVRQFTQDKLTSKQIYRVNALYEAPEYRKGDVIKIENNIYYLTNVQKEINAIDLKTGKKTTLKSLEKIDKREIQIIPKNKTKITKVYPNLEIMDLETYQSVPVKNTIRNIENYDFKLGQNVKVIFDEGIYYLLN
ncbi:MAG: NMD3-related protein [Candidatus Woesearchaeota archaeon]